MTTLGVSCGTCGAPLVLDGSTRTPTCTYCGTRAVIAEDVWRAAYPAADTASAPGSSTITRPDPRTPRVVLVALVALLSIVAVAVVASRRSRPPRAFGEVNGPCNGAEWACAKDGKAQLRCEDDRFVAALSCKGPKGCRVASNGTEVSCDYTYADPGDPCNLEDDACSTDHRAILHCDKSSFSVSATCKGPGGCTITPHDRGATLSCDDHVADPGDLCKGENSACAPDHRAMLACKLGKFVVVGACKGPEGCAVTSNPGAGTTTVACDGSIGDPQDLCQGGFACSSDASTLLRCDDAHLVVAERCPAGCTTSSDKVHCRTKTR